MKILGIEGTAWNASASVFDSDEGIVSLVSDPYVPESGGIHPREASEHISSVIPDVIQGALEDLNRDEIDAVAFSRGPGLGPCLRNVGTAARALSMRLDVPLVGVNHTVAHIEMGRYLSGFEDPIVLDAAGANTLITAYRNGRYRVIGETMDTGVGNALDKFARHAGLSHPGGPKIEELAEEGRGYDDRYVKLPYTVKGMDLSFSGIINAAESKYDNGVPLEKIAYSLQENIFGMLTEVSERALALTRKDELVVGGGVSRNSRLQEMLKEMCEERDAELYVPAPEYLSDNGAMIAVTGWMMYEAGQTIEVGESNVKPNWRPDEIGVEWRSSPPVPDFREDVIKGAEAIIEFEEDRVIKKRLPKKYRSQELDEELRRKRTASEARLTSEARRVGVPTPVVLDIDKNEATLSIERLQNTDMKDSFNKEAARKVGKSLARLHSAGICHGDPTTRNMIESDGRIYLIDFGLGYNTRDIEDFGMDIHVFKQTLEGTMEESGKMMEEFWSGYNWDESEDVRRRVEEIRKRGRYL